MTTMLVISGCQSMLSLTLSGMTNAAAQTDRDNTSFLSLDTWTSSGCGRGMGGPANDATLFWMGVMGLAICGLFGLNRYRQRIFEERDRKTITTILADERPRTAAEIVKASIREKSSLGPLSLSSIFVTLAKMEDQGLLESWDPEPAVNDLQIAKARERRLYRLAKP